MKRRGLNRKQYPYLSILALSMLAQNCSSPTISDVLIDLRSEKYVQSITAGNHILEFRYVPETLYYLSRASDLDSNTRFSKALLDSIKKADDFPYGLSFQMKLSPRNDSLSPTDFSNDVVYGSISGEGSYQETLNKYLFGLKMNIWLEIDGKKYIMSNYQMVRSWGMTKSRTFMLLFDDLAEILNKGNRELTLVSESIVPGQGRSRVKWNLPVGKYEYVNQDK